MTNLRHIQCIYLMPVMGLSLPMHKSKNTAWIKIKSFARRLVIIIFKLTGNSALRQTQTALYKCTCHLCFLQKKVIFILSVTTNHTLYRNTRITGNCNIFLMCVLLAFTSITTSILTNVFISGFKKHPKKSTWRIKGCFVTKNCSYITKIHFLKSHKPWNIRICVPQGS